VVRCVNIGVQVVLATIVQGRDTVSTLPRYATRRLVQDISGICISIVVEMDSTSFHISMFRRPIQRVLFTPMQRCQRLEKN
jgi:hypothetical protein